MDLAYLLDLIRQHGDVVYAFIFAYAGSHALLMALFAGYAAQMGVLDLGKTIMLCWAGSFVGDLLRFWIARRYGDRVLPSFPRIARGAGMVRRLVDRHGWWLPLVHRYPHGVRGIGGFAFGLSKKMSLGRIPAAEFRRRRAMGVVHGGRGPCLRPGLGQGAGRCGFGPQLCLAAAIPRDILGSEPEAGTGDAGRRRALRAASPPAISAGRRAARRSE